nr:MAG TPA: hypothetical protein [Caudoviricetes sp.]
MAMPATLPGCALESANYLLQCTCSHAVVL